MNRSQSIKVNLDGLRDLKKQLNTNYYVKVGILADGKAAESHGEIDNATLGVVHELGSIKRRIRARSWLRMPLESRKGELIKFLRSDRVKALIGEGKIKEVFKLLGLKAEAIIDSAFRSGGFGQWADLKESTIKEKGSAAILIDTSQLRRSVTSEVVKK